MNMMTKKSKIIKEMATATGVAEDDVSKVLEQIGFSRALDTAVDVGKGTEPKLDSLRVAFRVGKSTVVC
jgi:hypothetical protein